MQELDQFKTKMLAWAKKLAKDLTALNKKIKAAKPVVTTAPISLTPGTYEGQILVFNGPTGVKCYCWTNNKWNEVGVSDPQALENSAHSVLDKYITKAPDEQDKKPLPTQVERGHLFVNYGSGTIEMVDSSGNWRLANCPENHNGVPDHTPLTGVGSMVKDTNTNKIYMWNGATWFELGGSGASGDYISREEFNTALKAIQDNVSKIRG